MHVAQLRWQPASKTWSPSSGEAQLVLVFGATAALPQAWPALRERYGQAVICGCSTAGQIVGDTVALEGVQAWAVSMEHTEVRSARHTVTQGEDSADIGRALALALPREGLAHVLIISDGLAVNGSGLVAGLLAALPDHVAVTGGLAGDDARFERTLVCADAAPAPGAICAVGFYGDRLEVGYGSAGGWRPFGPDRMVTRSEHNVLEQLDSGSALDLYKRYLGEYAEGLPASALLFPLEVRDPAGGAPLVRTILSIDEDADQMVFAGDLPTGHYARLMRTNVDGLIDGAEEAAQSCESKGATLALLISCVGRRLVLDQRVEEEVEAVADVFGPSTSLAGFYSYGEICPSLGNRSADLHNQTMTITTFSER